jgi:Ca2+-transporting ATPase
MLTVKHHAGSGRLRLRLAGLRGNAALAARLQAVLDEGAAWQQAEVRAFSGSIIVHHDPAVPAETVVDRLQEILRSTGVTAGPAPSASGTPVRPTPPPEPVTPSGRAANEGQGWHSRSAAQVVADLASDPARGISAAVARDRLLSEGPNRLPQLARRSRLAMLGTQVNSLPVMMLAGSAVVSVATGGVADAVATLAVIATNAVLGYVTEGQAESVISALTEDDARIAKVRVIRDGVEIEAPAADLVRGDLYVVGAGMQVCADARLIRADRLMLDESTLTGETLPVEKRADAQIPAEAPIGARTTMLHAGTFVSEGRGVAMVVATGVTTVAARIAVLSHGTERPRAPVEVALDRLGTRLAYISLGACGLLFGIGLMRGQALAGLLRDAVALAVAAVPEGLPVVATATMALGLGRMEKRGILIRRIDAVEALGALQTICLDKTGTLTQNRMRVIAAAPGLAEADLTDLAALTPLAEAAALNNDAQFGDGGANGSSATEHALLDFAADCGIDIDGLRAACPRRATLERGLNRPWMATIHAGRQAGTVVKGAPDEVLARCTRLREVGGIRPLTEADRAAIRALNERLADRPARLLGFAEGRRAPKDDEVSGLTWLGLVALIDPLRPGAKAFIAALHKAGLDTVMITGDQSATAGAIARDLDLSRGAPIRIIDSPRIATMEPDLLSGLARRTHVFARVSADQKLAIVQALQRAGRVVAMTGDGTNDAPALKAADIGIAMGASGTVLARDVANVVIRDDELTTLIDAIGQGRAIYRNIRRALEFLVTTNMSEIVVSLVEALHGPGELETPLELLWINLVTDVLPGLGLALADPDPDVMQSAPRTPGEPIFPDTHVRRMVIDSAVISGASLAVHFIGLRRYGPGPQTRGMTFLALSLGQLLYTLTCQRSDVRKLRPSALLENRTLDLAVLGSAGMAVLPFLVPPLGRLLGVARLGATDTAISLIAAMVPAASVLARRGVALELHPLEEPT